MEVGVDTHFLKNMLAENRVQKEEQFEVLKVSYTVEWN